ncbi:MAG: MATE family efflux transporter [Traorella sp.]
MDLTKGNISKQIIIFTLPIILMNILNQAYVIIDTVIVSQFAGERALSIMSSTSAILSVGYCLINGLSSSAHILCANNFGRRDYEKLKNTFVTISISSLFVVLILGGIYFLFASDFMRMVELPEELLFDCVFLLRIYVVSFPIQILCQIFCSTLNGMGDSKTPMMTCICTQCLNIALDIVAIVILNLGVRGAAYASILSLFISMIWNYLEVKKKLKKLSNYQGHYDQEQLKIYIRITIPSILQQSIMSIGNLFLQRLVNIQGIEAINGYTVACNINNFLIIPVISYTNSFETFASQNIGSNNEKRTKDGFKVLLSQCGILCIVLSIVSIFLSKLLISMYLKDPTSSSFQFAYQFLIFLIPNYFALLFKYGIDALFKAHLKIYLFTISSLIALVARILFSYLFVDSFGLIVLAFAPVLGNVVAILFNICMKWYYNY